MATYTEKVVFPEITRPNTNAGLLKVALIAFGITLAIMVSVLPFKKTFIRDLLVGRETIEVDRVIFQGLTIFMWAMSAATVVIKKRRLKHEFKDDAVWVAGYSNDVMTYIPSLRVLKEGGYEAGDAMKWGSHTAPWSDKVEEDIVGTAHRLRESLR